MGLLRMLAFHYRQFLRTTYFVQLLFTSTLSMVALQAVAALAFDSDTRLIWIRAGVVGCWAVATTSAGIIGFQRFQGTLPFLVLTPLRNWKTLAPLVASATTFGLLAFPLSYALTLLLGFEPHIGNPANILIGVFGFWIGAMSISFVIASLFVLTPNAITYEGLLAVPFVLFSGVFGFPPGIPDWLASMSFVLPTSAPVQLMFSSELTDLWLAGVGAVVALGWVAVAGLSTRRAIRHAVQRGTLELT